MWHGLVKDFVEMVQNNVIVGYNILCMLIHVAIISYSIAKLVIPCIITCIFMRMGLDLPHLITSDI